MRLTRFLLAALAIVLALLVYQLETGESNSANSQVNENKQVVDDLKRAAVMYMAQPDFAGDDLTQQLTGTSAELVRFDTRTDSVYMSFPHGRNQLKQALPKIVNNPRRVRYAEPYDDGARLGPFVYNGSHPYFFGFHLENLNVKPNMTASEAFAGDLQYSVRLGELARYIKNKHVHGGRANLRPDDANESPIPNHGAYVTAGREPSLQRLVGKLVTPEMTREQKMQRLLDFVTTQVAYNQAETVYATETLKRAPEVLLSGGSDCSGKVILYASLLEQIGAEYVLIYMPHHLAVAVSGDFSTRNGYYVTWQNRTYVLAETTLKNFRIGRTRVADESKYQFDYLQPPGGGLISIE